ncbi:Zinc finger MYND domain-containing protein 10 [Lamellibrachia satsuma]|nr:Zinc finger MYND domain-containing protein 10 [Lamellibrachia satsuma]
MPGEAEGYIESLQATDLKDIGGPKWRQQQERIEKLNIQAAVSATLQEEEFVKEFLASYDKVSVLVAELITIEVWKQKVFTEFQQQQLEQKVIFPIYMVLYHEATLVNLLETTLYHQEAAEAGGDAMLDLTDYCYRKVTDLIAKTAEEAGEDDEDDENAFSALHSSTSASTLEELEKQNEALNFDISVKAVSIARYVIDHMSVLPLSVRTRMLNTHDFPMMFVELVENQPWTKFHKGVLKKYIDNKWQEIDGADRFKLTKIEGQVWLSLFQLLMSDECQKKYELNSYRKNVILKLRSHLTEVLLDQMPVLMELRKYLEQLTMVDPPAVKSDLLLEQIPEIRENILQKYDGRWAKIAKRQSKQFFNPSKEDMMEQAKRLADTYNFDVMENLLTDPPKCAVCGAEASKRCSRCQNEWYCRRECQVNHWKKHKKACDLMASAVQQDNQPAT